MSDKIYVNEIGLTIILDAGQDITGATGITIEVQKPDGTTASWSAEVYDSQYVKYVTVEDDLDQVGTYKLQIELTLSGWTGRGNTTSIRVYDSFK